MNLSIRKPSVVICAVFIAIVFLNFSKALTGEINSCKAIRIFEPKLVGLSENALARLLKELKVNAQFMRPERNSRILAVTIPFDLTKPPDNGIIENVSVFASYLQKSSNCDHGKKSDIGQG